MSIFAHDARKVIFPGAHAIIRNHLERHGWMEEAKRRGLSWNSDDIPPSVISAFEEGGYQIREGMVGMIIRGMLPRRYWSRRRDPIRASRWKRVRSRTR